MATELGKDHAPFEGVVMCCTSISPEERHSIASRAEEMGAVHKFDLTSDVTHLIVGDTNTAKYKYVAKERPDVKAILPSFVDAVRNSWIAGGETDVERCEIEHRAPTMYGLKICLTGFDSPSERDQIRSIVELNGADFHGDLTKAITHLIAAKASGRKYEHARRWGVPIVSVEWLSDVLKRGMVLDESLYDPSLAPQDRGKDAWNKEAMGAISLGKRPREEEIVPEAAVRGRKLRRTMSTKLESQQENIWAEIASGVSGQAMGEGHELAEQDSILDQGRARSCQDTVIKPELETTTTAISRAATSADTRQAPSTFRGEIVLVHGFDKQKSDILLNHLITHGARVFATPAMLQEQFVKPPMGFVVIPHNILEKDMPRMPEIASMLRPVTEWWVESCLKHKRMTEPDDYPLCKPFKQFGIEGFEQLTICSTGFKGPELLHITKVVDLMGATYSEYLRLDVNILICQSDAFSPEKFNFAVDNGIQAVSERWLYESVAYGVAQTTKSFSVAGNTPTIPVDYTTIRQKSVNKRSGLTRRTLPLEFAKPSVPLDRRKEAIPRNHATSIVQTKPRLGPFLEDEDCDDGDDGQENRFGIVGDSSNQSPDKPSSQPLRELSQNERNSPRRNSHQSLPSQPIGITKEVSSEAHNENLNTSSAAAGLFLAAIDAEVSQKDSYADAVALLQARQDAMGARRTASDPTATGPTKLRRGPLGRAVSGSFGSRVISSLESTTSQDDHKIAQRGSGNLPFELPPSQKIIYEEDNALEARMALIRQMGGQLLSQEVRADRVESIGVVKDAVVSLAAMGGRGRRRLARKG